MFIRGIIPSSIPLSCGVSIPYESTMDIRLMISDGTVGQGVSVDWELLEEGFLHRFSPSSKGDNWERFYISERLVRRQNIQIFFLI